VIKLELGDGTAWNDVTRNAVSVRHEVGARSLESLSFTLIDRNASVGWRCRFSVGTSVIFEGVVTEVRRRRDNGHVNEVECRAYSDLILYDRYIVFRVYDTGTTAGAIIRDLASLEPGVDVTDVAEGPSITSPWSIENSTALKVMLDVAKGTNHYLRMLPGRVLRFRPKSEGTPKATIDGSKVLSAEYSEDRWKLKNRVIYVGANGEVLADVSDPPGDLPVVVHDPFLTDANEALRRARIRLALNREYGRELRVEMAENAFNTLGIDLFDTVTVNLPDLGLNNVNMFIVEIEYDPRNKRCRLTLGGRLELLEDLLNEAIGGDTTARFGPRPSVIGELAGLRSTLYLVKSVTTASAYRYVTYWNRRPLTIHAGENVTLDPSTGQLVLASGFTSGWAEIRFNPPTETFRKWGYIEWISYPGDGAIAVEVRDPQGRVLVGKTDPKMGGWHLTKRLRLKRWPGRAQELTRGLAYRQWVGVNAVVFRASAGIVSGSCLGIRLTGTNPGEAVYTLPQPIDLGWARFADIFLYAFAPNTSVRLRLYSSGGDYYEGVMTANDASVWREYLLDVSTFSRSGNPNLGSVTRIGIVTNGPILVDSDYLFHQYHRGELVVRFTLSRPSASSQSPKISDLRITYEEVVSR